MDLGNGTQDNNATDAFGYVRPAKPWHYLWVVGVSFFGFMTEMHVYNNATVLQFLLSIPFFAFFIYVMLVVFFDAARMEMDEWSVRRSLLGWTFISLPWNSVRVIQGFYVPRQGAGLVVGYRVLAAKHFLMFGNIFFQDEAEVLAPKLNLIAKRFGIPLEQRLQLYSKFERVDAIQLR